jgi:hypothetical protein
MEEEEKNGVDKHGIVRTMRWKPDNVVVMKLYIISVP